MEKKQNVSRAVIRRIPRYYRFVSMLKSSGVQRVSSRALAESMGLTASQIRQDFNCFGGFGQQGYGYNVDKLSEGLAEILGLHRQRTAVLVGAGNLGRALMKNFDFKASGFELICAFDADKTVIGKPFGSANIRDVSELRDYVTQHKPDVAVLTVPQSIAAEMVELLVSCGVRGLWNFTGADLHLEELNVSVENVHLSDSLMTLCYEVDANSCDAEEV